MVGQSISHYRVLDKLGEGGMGVVYRAEDTKLGRPVALKFLAAHLLNDDEAKERFLREAKAAAALHHPNICPVYEIDEAEGRTFLAMAFLEGESLEERIGKGPLPLSDALDIGRQVAEGLSAAHAKGIVHRDIKPANILISSEGQATIMDFGLARLTEASKLTRPDQTVGTTAYMSSEQIQGAEVDHRSDIWALGCVLYEMVAGLRPFKGQYDQALLYEIVNEEPEPLTAIRAGVPMELEVFVGKCLEKEAKKRYSAAHDVAVDLGALAERIKSGRSAVLRSRQRTASSTAIEKNEGARWTRLLPWVLAAAAAVCAAAVSFIHFGEESVPPESYRFSVEAPLGTRFASHRDAANPAISPDGRLLAFIAGKDRSEQRLWLRPLDAVDATPLLGTEGAAYPFWSPDSRFLGFFSDGKLKKIDVAGGPAQTLCDAPAPRGADWLPTEDGSEGLIIFAPTNFGGLSVIPAAGGDEPRGITELNQELGHNAHRAPHFLPGGNQFLYMARADRNENHGVYVGRLDQPRDAAASGRFLEAEYGVQYAPPTRWHDKGYVLFQRADVLMAQALELVGPSIVGHPFPVGERVTSKENLTIGQFSASNNGVLAYQTEEAVETQLIWFDRDGELVSEAGEPGLYGHLVLSPDGQFVAVAKQESPQTPADIWLLDLSRDAAATRFTFDDHGDDHPIWSPDGKRIAFFSVRSTASPDIYVKAVDGSGEAEAIMQSGAVSVLPLDWTNDGLTLVYRAYSGGPTTVRTLSLDRERKDQPYRATSNSYMEAQLSPDDHWLAYTSDTSGRMEIYIQQFPTSDGRRQISTAGGGQPRWNPQGNELFFVSLDRRLMSVEVRTEPTLEIGSPEPLFETRTPPGVMERYSYDVSPDGNRFLINTLTREPRQAIEVVVNWQAQLNGATR